MWSKNKQKWIHSLALSKCRVAEGVFLAEGPKAVGDLMGHFPCRLLAGTAEYLAETGRRFTADEVDIVTPAQLTAASLLRSPRDVLAVFAMPSPTIAPPPDETLVLALDGIQDPGNLGTIIRVADWFGITRILCSSDTVDAFSPKVVQATMGALARVRPYRVDLSDYLAQACARNIPVYGTFLDGENIYETSLSAGGIIVMGNEGNGIRPSVEKVVSRRLHIPAYPPDSLTSESLNVAMATGIVCAEFRRRL